MRWSLTAGLCSSAFAVNVLASEFESGGKGLLARTSQRCKFEKVELEGLQAVYSFTLDLRMLLLIVSRNVYGRLLVTPVRTVEE
jgi:hypothetical protein